MSVRSTSGLLEQTAPATQRELQKNLRVLVTDYVPQFADRIEQAADEISVADVRPPDSSQRPAVEEQCDFCLLPRCVAPGCAGRLFGCLDSQSADDAVLWSNRAPTPCLDPGRPRPWKPRGNSKRRLRRYTPCSVQTPCSTNGLWTRSRVSTRSPASILTAPSLAAPFIEELEGADTRYAGRCRRCQRQPGRDAEALRDLRGFPSETGAMAS